MVYNICIEWQISNYIVYLTYVFWQYLLHNILIPSLVDYLISWNLESFVF